MTWKVLRLFFKGPTADDKHSLLSRGNLMQRIQMDLSQELKNFNQLFFAFFKSKLNFDEFQKKMTLIAYVSPKLRTPKKVVR